MPLLLLRSSNQREKQTTKTVAIGGTGRTESKLVKQLRDPITAGITGGVVLAIIVFVVMPGWGFNELSLARWLRILSHGRGPEQPLLAAGFCN